MRISLPRDAIVVDDYNAESNILAYSAGLPLLSSSHAYLANTSYDISVRDYVDLMHPRFMAYSDQGTLRKSLPLQSSCGQQAVLDGISFRCVFDDRVYRVYELSYHQ